LIKTCHLPIPRPPYRTPKLQEKPLALKREHPVLKNMKILDFFQFLWVIFALKNEHPALQNLKILYFLLFLVVIFALLDLDQQFECGS
jgi:hypothetical protein